MWGTQLMVAFTYRSTMTLIHLIPSAVGVHNQQHDDDDDYYYYDDDDYYYPFCFLIVMIIVIILLLLLYYYHCCHYGTLFLVDPVGFLHWSFSGPGSDAAPGPQVAVPRQLDCWGSWKSPWNQRIWPSICISIPSKQSVSLWSPDSWG